MTFSRRLVTGAAVASLGAGLAAQSWIELAFTSQPSARERHAMAYDGTRGETVLFGGFNGAVQNDTWVLDGSGWHLRSPATVPPARADHALAFDPVRQRVVMMGGWNGADLTDIWEWNGTNWSQRATSVLGLGQGGAACYDPTQNGVFYNRSGTNLLWDGTVANVVAVAQPVGSTLHRMVFDAASAGVITIIGQLTFRFTPPTGWEQISTASYFFLQQYAMAIDPIHHRVLFHGGDGTVGNTTGPGNSHTWEWTGTVWSLVAQTPPSLRGHAMVFDPQQGFLMFGGFGSGALSNRTWRLQEATTPATYITYGAGCAGSFAAAPRVQADLRYNSAPVLGGIFFAMVDQLPLGQFTVGFVGVDNTFWNGQPLPIALAPAGMPGCSILMAPVFTVSLGFALNSPTGGRVAWTTRIPNAPNFLGMVFFQQAAAYAPGANAGNALWSNAGQGIIGIR